MMMPLSLLQSAATQGWDMDLALVRMAFLLLGAATLTLVAAGYSVVKNNR